MELVCAMLVGLVILSAVAMWSMITENERLAERLRESEERNSVLCECCETFQSERDELAKYIQTMS